MNLAFKTSSIITRHIFWLGGLAQPANTESTKENMAYYPKCQWGEDMFWIAFQNDC